TKARYMVKSLLVGPVYARRSIGAVEILGPEGVVELQHRGPAVHGMELRAEEMRIVEGVGDAHAHGFGPPAALERVTAVEDRHVAATPFAAFDEATGGGAA